MGVLDFLLQAREAGRGARADLESGINYYIPPELRGLLGLAAEANPVVSMERAGQDAQRLVAPGMSGWDRMAAAGDMASNMAGVMLPMAGAGRAGVSTANAIEEVLTGMSRSPASAGVMDFATGDYGGVPLRGRTSAPFDMGGGSGGMPPSDTILARTQSPRQGPLAVDGTLGLPEDMQMPVTFNGKDVADWEPSDWGAFGEQYGVPNLGPTSTTDWQRSLVPLRTNSGREVTIPAGDGPFSYYDMLHLKSQGINPNDLHPDVHRSIHNRMVAAMGQGPLTDERISNQMAFGLISPNQPLTPNELALQRVMVKGPQDADALAGMVPYDYKGAIPDIKARQAMSRDITTRVGLNAAERGGLGASGSANYTDVAEMAQKLRDRPDFFRFDKNDPTMAGMSDSEQWSTFVARIMNETRGLKAKTGSLATVWQDPENAAISAIDRHMATLFKDEMFPDTKTKLDWQQAQIKAYNAERPTTPISNFDELMAAPGGRGRFVDAALAYVNKMPDAVTRNKSGEINPRIPPALAETKWVGGEPEKMQMIGSPYVRALEANQERATQNGQGLFSSQWMEWDRIRNRLEPHEVLFPGLEKLPRMNMEQMRRVNQDVSDAGYKAATGSVRPLPNASRAAYFSLPAAGLLGLTAAERENAKKPGPRKGKKAGT